MKNSKRLNFLKKAGICFIFLNLIIIRFNILSPIELKIFFDKNNVLINIIYIFLYIFAIVYLINWGIKFFKSKIISDSFIKLL